MMICGSSGWTIPTLIRRAIGGAGRVFSGKPMGRRSNAIEESIKRVLARPTDTQAHSELGDAYAECGRWDLSAAEYRTSIALGNSDPLVHLSLVDCYVALGRPKSASYVCRQVLSEDEGDIRKKAEFIKEKISGISESPLTDLEHNLYYRLKTLADYLLGIFPGGNFSVLDVGGGSGLLAQFLPEVSYVLAEPKVNGIGGGKLPFDDGSFDAVVACHVFEHVPPGERHSFLKDLCAKAVSHVILLGPFDYEGRHVRETLELLVRITGTSWAKEHLDCGLPSLDEVREFAAERNYGYEAIPNGSLAVTIAFVLMEHYANLAGRKAETVAVHRLHNTRYCELSTHSGLPAAHLVDITLRKGEDSVKNSAVR